MSLYPAEDERRIRTQALVREWTKSGLLDAAQGAALDAELRVNVRRTNIFLRGGLALFTTLIVTAFVALIVIINHLDQPIPSAVVAGVSAVVCAGLAHFLVVRERFYRFGVEEALAILAVALMACSACFFTYAQDVSRIGDTAIVAGLITGAVGGLIVYWRFGYVYAAIGAIACIGYAPYELLITASMKHGLSAVLLAAAFVGARLQHARYGDEYPGDDYGWMQAAAWAGLYFTLNLHIPFAFALYDVGAPFYWFTYAMIWALPLAGLALAIRGRDRGLLDVCLVMLLVTFLTNKPYLGWPRHEWDPILLGVFLMAAAIIVRRWLASGVNGQRAGFTPARILSSQKGAVTILGTASAGFHPNAPSYPESGSGGFDGGKSGGGGAAGTY